jgi:hypothetical protein
MGAFSPAMWLGVLVIAILLFGGIVFVIGRFGYLMGANKELRTKREQSEKRSSTPNDR